MTLITGIFGMNVAGHPGLEDKSAFLWVTLTYGRRGFSHVIDPSLEAVVLTFMPPDGESSKPRTIRRNTLAALLPTPFREAVPQDGQTVFIQL